jgi:hypothetical protein
MLRLAINRSLLLVLSFTLACASVFTMPAFAETDNTSPTLTYLSVTPSSVDVRQSTQTVNVEVRATDDMTGVKQVSFMAKHPTGTQGYDIGATMTNTSGDVWTGTLQFAQYIPAGDWLISAFVFDNAGNAIYWEGQTLVDNGFQGFINVQSNTDDVAPQLHSFSMSSTAVDVTSNTQSVNIEIATSDNLSGLNHVSVMFASPAASHSTLSTQFQLITGDNGVETWQGTAQFPRFIKSGDWPIRVMMIDVVGNVRYLDENALSAAGYPYSVSVLSDEDVTAPTLTDLTINPGSVNIESSSQTVSVNIKSTDDKSGVLSASLAFSSPSGSGADIYSSASVENGVNTNSDTTLTFTIPQYVEIGTWKARLFIGDAVGNQIFRSYDQLIAAGWPGTLTIERGSGGTSSAMSSSTADLPSLPSTDAVYSTVNGVGTQVLEVAYPGYNTVMSISVPNIFPIDLANPQRYMARIL